MFKPKKVEPSQLPNIRLPKLPANPGFDDIQYALGQAQKNRGRTVELPWTSLETKGTFMLGLKFDQDVGEPCWTMFAGDGADAKLSWTYVSGDMQLILNLVLAESTGGQLQDVSQAGAYVSGVKPKEQTEGGSSIGGHSAAPAIPSRDLDPSQTDTGRRAKAILEGDLTNMPVPNLLQSVVMSKMSGKLGVQNNQGFADIYFEEGVPVHAQTGTTKGDSAIIEILTWDQGEFHFYQDEHTSHRTVNKRLDSLLMEGIALVDQNSYLTAQGVKSQSYLLRKNKNLSEAQFEQMAAKGAPLDMMLQKQFYQTIDNKTTLFELLRRTPMPKSDWIPLMFNMISCDLVMATDKAPLVTQETALPLTALGVDQGAIETVVKAVQRAETGLFTYPAFLYFLELEFARFEAFGWPLSLIVFEMRYRPTGPQGPLEPLPTAAVKEIAQRIGTIKRKTDFLGHYEAFDYACLLSNTNTAAASMFANRVIEVIRSAPVPQTPDVRSISLSFGIACIPDDCNELGLLLAAVLEAKKSAKEKNLSIVLSRDLRKH